jgi:hypothetical protein
VWAIPVAIAVVLQALLGFSMPPEIRFDSASYIAQAQSLASDFSARNAKGEPDTVRTPGYPLLVAFFLATGFGLPGVVAAQRVLWVCVVAAVAVYSYRLTRHQGLAIIAAVITAVDLPALQASGSILTETLAGAAVSLTVWRAYVAISTQSIGAGVAAGLLAGVTAFIRPVATLFGAPLALAAVIAGPRQHRYRIAMAMLASSLVIPAAWTLRNYQQTGVVTFSSISSINLLLYRAAGSLAIRDPGGVDANLERRQAELEAAGCRLAEERFGGTCESIPISRRASLYHELAMPIIAGEPIGTALQAARACVMIMFGGGANMMARLTGLSESSARVIGFAYTVPLALLATIGLWTLWRTDRLAAALMALAIVYLVAMSLGTEAYSRFRVPFLSLYATLAASGAVAVWAKFQGRRSPEA